MMLQSDAIWINSIKSYHFCWIQVEIPKSNTMLTWAPIKVKRQLELVSVGCKKCFKIKYIFSMHARLCLYSSFRDLLRAAFNCIMPTI